MKGAQDPLQIAKVGGGWGFGLTEHALKVVAPCSPCSCSLPASLSQQTVGAAFSSVVRLNFSCYCKVMNIL